MSVCVVITCDQAMEGGTCAAQAFGHLPLARAVAEVRQRGWHVTDRGGAFCPAHRGGARS